MKGTRKDNPDSLLPKPGEYGRASNGDWFGMTPNGHLANLSAHKVVEHPDGTLTVDPSILVHDGHGTEHWHGFLRGGEWQATPNFAHQI